MKVILFFNNFPLKGVRKVIILLTILCLATCRREFPVYEIKIDGTPEEKYGQILKDLGDNLKLVYDEAFNHLGHGILKPLVGPLSLMRGKEEPELEAEIEYFAKATGLPKAGMHVLQWYNELGSIMIPIENITSYSDIFGEKWAKILGVNNIDLSQKNQTEMRNSLKFLEMKMCTGIIAKNTQDGTVNHARNFDNQLFINKIQYIGNYTLKGKEVFVGFNVAGFSGIFTGYKKGNFAIEVNTRFPDHVKGNEQMLDNLLVKKTPLLCWEIRKQLTNTLGFDNVINFFSTTPLTATNYLVISGIKEGTILARNPSSVEHKLTLGVDNDNYIIVTNFDYWNHDIREYFDQTAGELGKPRRIFAEEILNSTSVLTPEVLNNTINAKGVIADTNDSTIMQAIMNVETGYLWTTGPVDL